MIFYSHLVFPLYLDCDYGKNMHDVNFHKIHIKTKCLFCKKSFFQIQNHILTLLCSVIERTEMNPKIYLSEAWMCSEFGYQCPMLDKKELNMHPGNLTPKECKLCGKGFESNITRRKHWRTHPMTRKCYRQCDICYGSWMH